MHWKKTLLACVGTLLAGGLLTTAIFFTEPTAERSGAVKETAMLVDVAKVERSTYVPHIRAMGTVEPSQDVMLNSRVAGEIVRLAPAFTPGGYVQKGDTLLQIDPADYENTLQQRQSELRQALADLSVEMGRQKVAKQDYALLDDLLSQIDESLVLREPQLEAARSRVESARAAVKQAELDLKRTTITAPFEAHILSRQVNVGSQVSPGESLGRLVGLETYWVAVTLPLAKLRWLTFPENDGKNGARVTIRNRTAWGSGASREGRLFRLVGALEGETRLARVLVSVPDPHALRTQGADLPLLILGSFLEVSIEGEELTDVVRLDRDYVRSGDTVWVMKDGKLNIRDVDILLRDAEYAYVTQGLDDGDQVVTTNLSTVAEGARLRVEPAESARPQSTTPTTEP